MHKKIIYKRRVCGGSVKNYIIEHGKHALSDAYSHVKIAAINNIKCLVPKVVGSIQHFGNKQIEHLVPYINSKIGGGIKKTNRMTALREIHKALRQ